MRKLNPSILAMVPESPSIPAREIWDFLARYFDREDVLLQFAICGQLETLRMKGADNADKYVQVHIHANVRLARMGALLGNWDAIYLLLHSLLTMVLGHSSGGPSRRAFNSSPLPPLSHNPLLSLPLPLTASPLLRALLKSLHM
jgi:hypothetical protein